MAVSAQPTPPFCTSLRSSAGNSIGFYSSNLPLCLFSFRTMGRRRTSSLIVFCNESSAGVAGRNRRDLLEGYGIDLDEFLSEPFPKPRKRKEWKNNGKGKQSPDEKPKSPRETHKLLQVLGGKARRMKLISPKGMDVRPMMEVVKGATFSILQVAGGCPALLRSGRWLDLYSGTGSVGIEALSRGCSEVHFVEMDPWVVSDVLRPNLEWTKFLDISTIHTVPVESFLERARHCVEGTFDYISVTPPYTEVVYKTLMGQISESGLIGEDTFIVVEYPLKTNMSDSCGCLLKIADRRFGRTNLAIYGPKWAQKKRDSVESPSA